MAEMSDFKNYQWQKMVMANLPFSPLCEQTEKDRDMKISGFVDLD